jgi:hypothetical protein
MCHLLQHTFWAYSRRDGDETKGDRATDAHFRPDTRTNVVYRVRRENDLLKLGVSVFDPNASAPEAANKKAGKHAREASSKTSRKWLSRKLQRFEE